MQNILMEMSQFVSRFTDSVGGKVIMESTFSLQYKTAAHTNARILQKNITLLYDSEECQGGVVL